MKKSIIEKLEMNTDFRGYVNCVYLENLQKQRNKMLEALIESRKFMERLPSEWFSEITALKLETAIEKGTNNKYTWPEIKELLYA